MGLDHSTTDEFMKGTTMQEDNELVVLYKNDKTGFFGQWIQSVQHIVQYWFFIKQLVRINILNEFKRSFLGLGWLFIVPILAVLIWILLNGAGIVDPGDTGIPYPAYVLLSTSIWGFFSEIYKSMSNIINQNGKMMIMTYFPHEVLIMERVLVHFIRFSIPFLLNLVVLLYFGVKFTWAALLFPLTLIPLLFIGVGIGLIGSMLRIVAIDASNLLDEAIRLLMFLTPIVYAPRIDGGWLSDIVQINPLTYLIGFSRDILTQGTFFEPQSYFICAGVSLVFFLIAYRLFHAAEPKILERLINT